jgi:predicted nuclease of predicted toxin-antitoxin system
MPISLTLLKVFFLNLANRHARDVNLQSASDDKVFNFPVKNKVILVTRDLEFGNPYLYPRNSHYGLIIVRVPFYFTAKQINKILKEFLSSIETKNLERAIID